MVVNKDFIEDNYVLYNYNKYCPYYEMHKANLLEAHCIYF